MLGYINVGREESGVGHVGPFEAIVFTVTGSDGTAYGDQTRTRAWCMPIAIGTLRYLLNLLSELGCGCFELSIRCVCNEDQRLNSTALPLGPQTRESLYAQTLHGVRRRHHASKPTRAHEFITLQHAG